MSTASSIHEKEEERQRKESSEVNCCWKEGKDEGAAVVGVGCCFQRKLPLLSKREVCSFFRVRTTLLFISYLCILPLPADPTNNRKTLKLSWSFPPVKSPGRERDTHITVQQLLLLRAKKRGRNIVISQEQERATEWPLNFPVSTNLSTRNILYLPVLLLLRSFISNKSLHFPRKN